MMNSPSVCPRCATPVSIGGGRCPSCGFEIPAPESPPRPPTRRPILAKPKASPAILPVTAVLVVAAGALFAWRLRMDAHTNESAAPSMQTATAGPSATVAPRRLDSTSVFDEAKKRALAWNAEALLIEVHAHGVVDRGQIDVEHGGNLELVFGKPMGAKLVAGERVDRQRFVAHADASGLTTHDEQAKPGAVAAGDPNCTLDEAWSKGVAAGLPSTQPLDVHYSWDERRGRSVWSESAGDDAASRRTLDGWNCAIVVR